ncbi:uncharacterized protein METZ01_LOCUS321896, partial [marine metagenome]
GGHGAIGHAVRLGRGLGVDAVGASAGMGFPCGGARSFSQCGGLRGGDLAQVGTDRL